MAQFARPDADQAVGSWTPTPAWSRIDEDITGILSGDDLVITSDAVGNNTATSFADVRLSDVTDPAVSTGHIISVRWNHDMAVRSLRAQIELWEGIPGTGTKRAEIVSAADVGAVEVQANYTLSGAEADSITDYTNLYFRFWGFGTGGGPARSLVVEAAQFETPDAPAGGATVTPGVIAATVALPAAGKSAGSTLAPATIAAPVSLPAATAPGSATGSMSFAGAAALVADTATLYELTGQTEVVAEVTAQTSVTNVQQLLVGKLNDGSSVHDCWVFFGLSTTASRWRLRQSDTTLRAWTLGTGSYIDTSRHVYRLDFDASLKRATWFKDGSQVGSAVDLADWNSTYNTSSTAPARIGAAGNSDGSGLSSAFTGDIEKVTVYTDLARTTKLFEVDFTDSANGSQTTDPWDTWTDSNANTWTMVGTGWTYNEPAGGGGATASPATVGAVAALPSAGLSAGSQVSPGVLAAPASLPATGVSAASTASPDAVAAPVALPAATLSAGSTVTPATLAALTALPGVNISAGATVSPDVLASVVAVLQASPQTGNSATVTPTVIAALASLPGVTVSAGWQVTPATLAAIASVPQATSQTGSNATRTPDTIALLVALPQATPSAGSQVAPGTITGVVALPQATTQTEGNATASPGTIGAAASLPGVSIVADSLVTPATISAPAALPQVTVQAGSNATVSPETLAAVASLPGAVLVLDADRTPDAVVLTVLLPAATPSAGSTVTPDVISMQAVLPQATAFAFIRQLDMRYGIPVLKWRTLPPILKWDGRSPEEKWRGGKPRR